MQMPERARIRALKEEVIKHIEENNVRNFPGCEGKLFLISTAYPGVWLEHAYDAVSYANYTPEGRQVLAGEMRLFLDRQREDGQLPCYVLGDLPAGFVQTSWQRLGPAMAAADYESADGDYLYLDYSYMQQGGGTFIDMDEGEVIQTQVNGMKGYFFQDADPEAFDILTWTDTRQNIQFTLGGCMDLDQALALAKGLKQLDTDP